MFLSGAVALILLIACANVANLMLANAESRQHELAVGAAIGAGRARLARQFVTESLLLAGSGGALGVITAVLAMRAALSLFPDAVPRSAEVGLHLPVLAFAAVISSLTAVALGLATALRRGIDEPARQATARGHAARMTRLRQGLIVAEVSLVLMLMVGAGLMIKSYWLARSVDLGFAHENLLAINVSLPGERYPDRESATRYYESLAEALAAIPELRGMVRQIDPAARVWRTETMEDIVARALGDRRFQLILISTFAAVAMALGAVGTYGVVAYTVEGQMREFGIRMAVGAAAGDIRSLVLRGAGSLAAIGLVLGMIGAYALRRYISGLLFQVQPWDPAMYGGAALTLGMVALLACWVPARRAARVDPVVILRRE